MIVLERLLGGYARTKWRGFDRLLAVSGYASGKTIVAPTNAGTRMNLNPYSYIDRHVLHDGYYETEVLDAIVAAMTPDGVLWDIGANIGLHSIAVKNRFPSCTVYSFEPSPPTLGALWRNAALNKADLGVFGLALSDADALATLHIAHDGNPGMTTLAPFSPDAYQSSVTVATARGDTLIAGRHARQPTVVKIDVEGHELAALTGMAAALAHSDCRRVIFEDGPGDSGVKNFLTGLGFTIALATRREATEHNLDNFVADKA